MTTVMKASSSADFLAMVPALAGCTPSRSLVLVPFERGRAYGALRMDLPSPGTDLADYAAQATALAARVAGTDAVAVVVYTDEEPIDTPDGLVLPWDALLEHLYAAVDAEGLRLIDALCATPQGWACHLDDRPRLAPMPRTPAVDETVAGGQAQGAELPAVDLAAKERVGRALLDLREAICLLRQGKPFDDRLDPRALEAAVLLDDVPALAEAVLDAPDDEDADPYVTAALLWMLEQPMLRDAVLLQWASDLAHGIDALEAQLAYRHEGVLPPDDLGGRLVGAGPRPDLDRLRAALRLARTLAAHAPRGSRSGPLAVAAWMSWALGNATHARLHLDALTAIDPGYGFARLLLTLLDAKQLPDWAFESRADLAA